MMQNKKKKMLTVGGSRNRNVETTGPDIGENLR